MITTKDIAQNVFSANEAATLATKFANERKEVLQMGTPITWGMPSLDNYLNPMMAGDLITIIGRPANGKTYLAMYLLDRIMNLLFKSGKPNEAVVLVTLEVSVERSALYQMARMSGVSVRSVIRGEADQNALEFLGLAAFQLGEMPFFIIGHSTQRASDGRRKRPDLSPDNITRALEYIMNEYVTIDGEFIEPRLLVIDYLQRMTAPPGMTWNEHYSLSVDWAKNTAIWAGCPVVLAVQAKRDVDERQIKMPTLADGQSTSNVEQSSDFSFGVWMPKTAGLKRVPKFGGLANPVDVTDTLMLVSVLKQKDGPAGLVQPLYIDPDQMKLGEMYVE